VQGLEIGLGLGLGLRLGLRVSVMVKLVLGERIDCKPNQLQCKLVFMKILYNIATLVLYAEIYYIPKKSLLCIYSPIGLCCLSVRDGLCRYAADA